MGSASPDTARDGAPSPPSLPRRRSAAILPVRVQRAIAEEEDRSEQIIGWFQMVLIALFAGLYLVAPRPEGRTLDPVAGLPEAWLPGTLDPIATRVLSQPVLWALGLYLTITVIRLVWAYRARLPAWSLVLSIAIDMTLLMGLIWSFHLQYGQPPAFYLKAPTFVYVFIFIALRALRFDARYVLIAGAAGALGWFALVAYAAAYDPSGEPTTRNYVEYMTAARILWGAEVDKIFAIAVVSALLSLSIRAARGLMMSAIAEGEAARDLRRFFSTDVAHRITGADEAIRPGQGELRDAAILFLDLRSFTITAKTLAPDETVRLLSEYQARMVPIIQRHNGSIDKFLGDGILASFGCASPSDRYAADALSSVDEVMTEVAIWNRLRSEQRLDPVRVGAAVVSGRVLFGAVGDDTRLEYTVIGDAVNLAAKLEKHTKIEQVRALTTDATYALARSQGYRELKPRRADVAVPGVDERLDLVVLA